MASVPQAGGAFAEIRDHVQRVASEVGGVAASTQESGAATQEVAATAPTVASDADRLRELVAGFTV